MTPAATRFPARSVALVGCRYVSLNREGIRAFHVEPAILLRRALHSFSFVILGSRAIQAVEPEIGVPLLRPIADRTLLCMATCDHRTLSRFAVWVQAGFAHVSVERIADEVERRLRWAARPAIPPEQWLVRVPAPGSPGAEAVSALARLDRFHVNTWASELGWRRDRLLRVCKREFGVDARTALQRYRGCVIEEMQAGGSTQEVCASVLQLHDAKSVRRAISLPSPRPE